MTDIPNFTVVETYDGPLLSIDAAQARALGLDDADAHGDKSPESMIDVWVDNDEA